MSSSRTNGRWGGPLLAAPFYPIIIIYPGPLFAYLLRGLHLLDCRFCGGLLGVIYLHHVGMKYRDKTKRKC